MKTIGLIPIQQLISLHQDEEGNWIDIPEGQSVVPLVKLPQPETSNIQKSEPLLVWYEDRVERDWQIIDKTSEDLAAELRKLPDAEKYQVLDWLDDYGITSADVEAALQSIPDETQKRKALLRWHSVNRIPADNAFVIHVASQLGINHIDAWSQILTK